MHTIPLVIVRVVELKVLQLVEHHVFFLFQAKNEVVSLLDLLNSRWHLRQNVARHILDRLDVLDLVRHQTNHIGLVHCADPLIYKQTQELVPLLAPYHLEGQVAGVVSRAVRIPPTSHEGLGLLFVSYNIFCRIRINLLF